MFGHGLYKVLGWVSPGYDDVSLADQLPTPNPRNIVVSKVWKNVWLGRGKHQQNTEHISFWCASGGTARGRQTQPDSVGQVRRNRASRKLVSIINQWAGKYTKTRHACVSTITLNARGELGSVYMHNKVSAGTVIPWTHRNHCNLTTGVDPEQHN